ncbi:hypothetical protein LTR37_001483 [Vermiconidia calcicola]|uniref:Uncharacterized protein n=1 Tax=Vermiconidia calcicola TaxID=1690605 RepID=A0ACC3NX71_9PEZI|nr:hypothetical protein LTR37_001483 [Vermiconidia calcicola]
MATLLTIPGVIRNHIYDLALPKNAVHYFGGIRDGPPALSRASHQLRKETLPIWRSSNRFVMQQYETELHPDGSNVNYNRFRLSREAGFEHIENLDWVLVWHMPKKFNPHPDEYVGITLVIEHSECCLTIAKEEPGAMSENWDTSKKRDEGCSARDDDV